jgi:hypothetical protein
MKETRIQSPEFRIQNPKSGWSRQRSLFWILASGFWILSAEILSAEIIDRIAISVGTQVITESQIEEELRLTEFLNQEKLNLDIDARKKAAGRLIEQALVRREIELSHYPMPELADSEESLAAVKARFASDAEYKGSLEAYGLSEDALQQRLLWQASFLRFIDYRFRPGIQIADADIQAYYQQQLEKWKQAGKQPVPPFEDVRGTIEETLTQQRIDQSVERWLADTRSLVRIRFVDETLAPPK